MELRIDHVSKQFKDKRAVEDVSLCVTPGVWGLLGANGAGKTTLMRIIAGIMKPDSGQVIYDGLPIEVLNEKYRDIFGYLPQEFGFYPEFSVQDYLEYVAALKGLTKQDTRKKMTELLERLALKDVKNKKITKLSGGMKKRVGIAQALLNDPYVLILDEPTSGLDPGERVRFRNLLSEFAYDRIVLISMHIVPDIEYIATKNAVMKNGQIIAEGTTEELVRLVEGKVWESEIPAQELPVYEQKLRITKYPAKRASDAFCRIVNLRNEGDGGISIRYLSDQAMIQSSRPVKPRLEDLYLWLFPQEGEEKR